MSTWDKSNIKYSNDEGFDMIDITEDMIYKHIPNCNVKIHKMQEVFPNVVEEDKYILFHWKCLIDMVKLSNVTYDLMVLIRPDLSINYLKNENKFKLFDNRIYAQTLIKVEKAEPLTYFMGDWFYMGTYNTMMKIFDNIPNNISFTTHKDLPKLISDSNIYVESLNMFMDYGLIKEIKKELI
jgi:hypothetical protein